MDIETQNQIEECQNAVRERNKIEKLNIPIRKLNREIKTYNSLLIQKRKQEAIASILKKLKLKRHNLTPTLIQEEVKRLNKENPLPLKHLLKTIPLANEFQSLLDKESEDLKELKKIKPETWLHRVRPLNESIKQFVASIVWWDFFSSRSNSPWKHLDEWVKAYNFEKPEPKPEKLVYALISVGYSPFHSWKRVQGQDEEIE